MNPVKFISKWWKDLSLTLKFSCAFWLLLLMMFLFATGDFFILNQMAQRTENEILASREMERLVLEMDRGFERARILQRDFFRLYTRIGYTKARDIYAEETISQVTNVIVLSSRLKQLIGASGVSQAVTKSAVDINHYLSASEWYREAFMRAVKLLAELSSEETGLQAQLRRCGEVLEETLHASGSQALIPIYMDLKLKEKDYGVTHSRADMQEILAGADLLLRSFPDADWDDESQKNRAADLVREYKVLIERLATGNAAMETQIEEFDLQAASLALISKKFIALAEEEVEQAQVKLHRARSFAFSMLLAIIFSGAVFALAVVHFWNRGVTRPIIRLTRIAREIQEGNLDAEAPVESADELGQLARALNSMSQQIKSKLVEMEALNENLQASEEKYRRLFEDSHDIIVVARADGTILDMSNAAVTLLGCGLDKFIEGSVRNLFVKVQDWVLFIHELEREEFVENMEAKIGCTDGRQIHALVNAALQKGPDGAVSGFQVVFHNITERKRAQEALAESRNYLDKIINSAADPIFVKDRNHGWVMVNDAFCSVLGYDRELLIGKTESDLFSSEDAAFFQALEEAVFTSGQENVNEEKITDSAGNIHTVVTKRTLYRDEQGGEFIVGVMRDMTESRRLEQQLWQAVKMEAVGNLAGGVAHDFNNLMTAVIGYCDLLLLRLKVDDNLRKDVEQIRRAGEKAATLTNQLLSFSRKQVLQPKIIDLNFLLNDMMKMLRRVIGEDIDLEPRLGTDPWRVYADPNLLEQVILNLAVNARDAMPQGGKLILETRNVCVDQFFCEYNIEMKPGDYVLLSVTDTGMGMGEDILSHIFEPFFTTKEKGKGTGLGLATAYGIVKQSGGHILAASEPGVGTTFRIYFPRTDWDPDRSCLAEPAACAPGYGKETILLVEDEDVVRDLVGRSLRMYGYTVLEASRGEEALGLFERDERSVQLLITDVIMPGMSGCELAKKLTEIRPGLRVLYISGYTGNAVENLGIADSGAAFLQKPFSPEVLAFRVREILDSPGAAHL